MTGFEPRTSGVRSDRSTNWATTFAPNLFFKSHDFTVGDIATTWIKCSVYNLRIPTILLSKFTYPYKMIVC